VQENENNNKNKKYASCTGIKIQTVERVSCFFCFYKSWLFFQIWRLRLSRAFTLWP